MSGRLVGEVLRDPLEDAPVRARRGLRAVLVALAEAAGAEGLAYPCRATIADRTLLSERQVIRLLRQLEELGRITCAGHRDGGRGKAPRWRVHPRVKGDTTTPFRAPERVTPRTVKGDTIVSPEPTDRTKDLPLPRGAGRFDRGTEPLPASPSLPGLAASAEGVTDLGTPRQRGVNPRALGESPRQVAARAEAARRRQLEADRAAAWAAEEAATAATPEERRAAREAALASTAIGRTVLRARAAG